MSENLWVIERCMIVWLLLATFIFYLQSFGFGSMNYLTYFRLKMKLLAGRHMLIRLSAYSFRFGIQAWTASSSMCLD